MGTSLVVWRSLPASRPCCRPRRPLRWECLSSPDALASRAVQCSPLHSASVSLTKLRNPFDFRFPHKLQFLDSLYPREETFAGSHFLTLNSVLNKLLKSS